MAFEFQRSRLGVNTGALEEWPLRNSKGVTLNGAVGLNAGYAERADASSAIWGIAVGLKGPNATTGIAEVFNSGGLFTASASNQSASTPVKVVVRPVTLGSDVYKVGVDDTCSNHNVGQGMNMNTNATQLDYATRDTTATAATQWLVTSFNPDGDNVKEVECVAILDHVRRWTAA